MDYDDNKHEGSPATPTISATSAISAPPSTPINDTSTKRGTSTNKKRLSLKASLKLMQLSENRKNKPVAPAPTPTPGLSIASTSAFPDSPDPTLSTRASAPSARLDRRRLTLKNAMKANPDPTLSTRASAPSTRVSAFSPTPPFHAPAFPSARASVPVPIPDVNDTLGRPKLTIHPVIFNDTNSTTFEKMIEKGANKLFVYNENFEQYRDGSKNIGGGNATIRPYRQDIEGSRKDGFSLGIPTGYITPEKQNNTNQNQLVSIVIASIDYSKLNDFYLFSSTTPITDNKATDLFIISLKNIYIYIKNNPNITELYYSADKNDDLGYGTFGGTNPSWTNTNKLTIGIAFRRLIDEIKKIRTVTTIQIPPVSTSDASSASSASVPASAPAPAVSSTSKPSNITYNVQLSGDIIKVQGKIAHRIKVVPDKDNRYNITFLKKPIVIISTDLKKYTLNNNNILFLTKKGILEKINEIKNNLLNYSISQSDIHTTGMLSRDDMTKFEALTGKTVTKAKTRYTYNILSIFGVNNYTFTNKNGKYTHVAIINYIISIDKYLEQLYNLIATNYDENNLLLDNFNKLYTELTKSIDQLAKLLEYKLLGVIDENTGKVLNESSKINNNTIERIIYTALSRALSYIKDSKTQIQQSMHKTNELGIYGETK
jgi:hypothetical protein